MIRVEKTVEQEIEQLRAKLEAAKKPMPGDNESRLHQGTIAAVRAISGVAEFLDKLPGFAEMRLSDPLRSIATALAELEIGIQSPMLAKGIRRNGAPPMATEAQVLYGKSVIAVDAYHQFGGMDLDSAAKKVARALARAGYRLPKKNRARSLADTLKGWHTRTLVGDGGGTPDVALRGWAIYQSEIQARAIDGIDFDPDHWLRDVCSFVAESKLLTTAGKSD